MLKLNNVTFTKNGVLVICDKDIERFAYAQLIDYDKNHFKKPHALDVDDFVENYLQRNVVYYKLSLNRSILGATILSNGNLSVINSLDKAEIKMFFKGTICIDLEACCNETCANFTIIHESWHSQYDINVDLKILENMHIIHDSNLTIRNNTKSVTKRSAKEWMEQHANRYATYILMPKMFVKKLFKEKRKEFFGTKKKITKYRPQRTWLIISSIARILNVSSKAVAYRLRSLKLISNEVFLSLKIF